MCTFLNLSDCAYSLWSSCVLVFTYHVCTTFHYKNNTMAYNIQQNITSHCCLAEKASAQGSLAFLLWKVDRLVSSQKFCLTFCEYFRKVGLLCIWPHIPEFKQSKCFHVHSHKYACLPGSWKYPVVTFQTLRIGIVNDAQWSWLCHQLTELVIYSSFPLNALTEAHADSVEQCGKLIKGWWAQWDHSTGWSPLSSIFKLNQILMMAWWNSFRENICL